MSDKPELEDVNKDPEKFITALYDTLDKPQTSQTLDDKILKAARACVNDVAPVVKLKKRPAWLKPVSAAAMLMLVATVSLHQIFDPSAPLNSEHYVSESRLQNGDLMAGKALSAAPKMKQEKRKQAAVPMASMQDQTTVAYAPAKERVKAKSKPKPQKNAMKKTYRRDLSELAALSDQLRPTVKHSIAKSQATSAEVAVVELDQALIFSDEEEASSPIVNRVSASAAKSLSVKSQTVEILSIEAFKPLSLNNNRWIYQKQNDAFYFLQLLQKNVAEKKSYRLLKVDFELSGLTQNTLSYGTEVKVRPKY
ncbi:MAG: hypothetical protein HRU20_06155 [Pseudomonadales bacterium]|nr:hypothetical protein [Pseudomonadales bacterium]